MLTSQAGDTLRGVHTVIIDEVHDVAATRDALRVAALWSDENPEGTWTP